MHLGCASHTQKHGGVIILMSQDELAAFSHDLLSVAVPSVKRTHTHTQAVTAGRPVSSGGCDRCVYLSCRP